MPDFWEFPTVSMGLGPMNAIYQARFNHYLHDRGIKDTSDQHVWAFLGDGEMDEPESRGAAAASPRSEGLDNLTFVVNCNLQRLDGPVRGNGKIIQELESFFRGAGWNVIKVVWGREWDALLHADRDGALVNLMNTTPDGDYQTYKANDGALRPRALLRPRPAHQGKLVETWTDDEIWNLKRGGHDYRKVYAAYRGGDRAQGPADGHPGQDHQGLHARQPLRGPQRHPPDEEADARRPQGLPRRLQHPDHRRRARRDPYLPPYYHPGRTPRDPRTCSSGAARSAAACPTRRTTRKALVLPGDTVYDVRQERLGQAGSRHHDGVRAPAQGPAARQGDRPRIVPIIPDEARTFGMDSWFPTRRSTTATASSTPRSTAS